MFYIDFSYIFINYFLILFISVILFSLSFIFSLFIPDYEKNSTYECGFLPFNDARSQFDIQFCVIAILYLVFDLELMFLLPWVIYLNSLTFKAFLSVFFFLLILLIAFFYEWKNNALVWSSFSQKDSKKITFFKNN